MSSTPHLSASLAIPFILADTTLSTFLVCRKHAFTAAFDAVRNCVLFGFADTPELRADVDAYHAGATVVARDHAEAGRMVRNVVRMKRNAALKAAGRCQ